MNPKKLEENYQKYKDTFHKYIDSIKKNMKVDIYSIINPTLIKNPYASDFPKRYFMQDMKISKKYNLFVKNLFRYYIKNSYLFISYFIAFVLYKIYYKKSRKNEVKIIIDIFGLVDKVNQSEKFNENYLASLYEVLEKQDIKYTILLRLYQVGKNPFKLIKFFKILNKDKRDFVFEYEFLNIFYFMELFWHMIVYPFKTLRLIQKEKYEVDKIFNYSLLYDIKHFSFDGLTRYILGKNLSKLKSVKRVFSWSEFQVIERSFNYAIRKNNDKIKLIGLQFYLNYETYFNAYVDDIDEKLKTAPHKVLVNGKYYIKKRKNMEYLNGVSLRYKDIFSFTGIENEKNILLLGSYTESDTKYMLKYIKDLDNIIFKNHPAVNINVFGVLPVNIKISDENIYQLFKYAKLVIGSASGTSVEAVACGISVIIIASQDNLTANPLTEYGKGKIWDLVFSESDVEKVYNRLIQYRESNMIEIQQISSWYKDNFFYEPTEENILDVFEMKEEDK